MQHPQTPTTHNGSFGFEMELLSDDAELAVSKMMDIYRTAQAGSDVEFQEAVSQVHPRAIKKMVQFLKLMKTKGVRPTISMDGQSVTFPTDEDVHRAWERLSAQTTRHSAAKSPNPATNHEPLLPRRPQSAEPIPTGTTSELL